jgi:hypothetical protein
MKMDSPDRACPGPRIKSGAGPIRGTWQALLSQEWRNGAGQIRVPSVPVTPVPDQVRDDGPGVHFHAPLLCRHPGPGCVRDDGPGVPLPSIVTPGEDPGSISNG